MTVIKKIFLFFIPRFVTYYHAYDYCPVDERWFPVRPAHVIDEEECSYLVIAWPFFTWFGIEIYRPNTREILSWDEYKELIKAKKQ